MNEILSVSQFHKAYPNALHVAWIQNEQEGDWKKEILFVKGVGHFLQTWMGNDAKSYVKIVDTDLIDLLDRGGAKE